MSIDGWFDRLLREGVVAELLAARDRTVSELDTTFVKDGIRALYQKWDELKPCFDDWFATAILTAVPAETVDVLAEVFRFDQATMPVYDGPLTASDLDRGTFQNTP